MLCSQPVGPRRWRLRDAHRRGRGTVPLSCVHSQPLERWVASRALTNDHSVPESATARGESGRKSIIGSECSRYQGKSIAARRDSSRFALKPVVPVVNCYKGRPNETSC
jgi:hypothetical protein